MRHTYAAVLLSVLVAACVAACEDGGSATSFGGGWSCAAHCVEEYSCTGSGDSTWTTKLQTSHGPTAAAAYKELVDSCSNASSRLVVGFYCGGGHRESESASLASSCARD